MFAKLFVSFLFVWKNLLVCYLVKICIKVKDFVALTISGFSYIKFHTIQLTVRWRETVVYSPQTLFIFTLHTAVTWSEQFLSLDWFCHPTSKYQVLKSPHRIFFLLFLWHHVLKMMPGGRMSISQITCVSAGKVTLQWFCFMKDKRESSPNSR